MNFFANIIFQHLKAAVLANWGTTVSGIIGAVLMAGPALYHTYIEGHSIQTVDLGLFGGAVWILVVNAIRAKFSWGEVLGALMRGAPRAQLLDMTKQNTTK
jgi:ABC-type uncharacterized transport system permease subunit